MYLQNIFWVLIFWEKYLNEIPSYEKKISSSHMILKDIMGFQVNALIEKIYAKWLIMTNFKFLTIF